MGVQNSYNYATPRGIAGGLFDLGNYEINTRINREDEAPLFFGCGVVAGANKGTDITLPTASSVTADYEGVVMNGFTTQHDLEGVLKISPNQSIGVLQYGNAWVRIGENAMPSYGKDVYLILSGKEAGFFTTTEDTSEKMAIPARYLGEKSGSIAPAKFYHQKATV